MPSVACTRVCLAALVYYRVSVEDPFYGVTTPRHQNLRKAWL